MWPFLNNMPTLPSLMGQWQDMWMKPQAASQPVNPIQQAMEAWQKMWLPAMATAPQQAASWPSPKVTVMTIELGDMRAYIEPAMAMLSAWQSMMPQIGHNPFSHNLNRQNFWPMTNQAGRA